MGKTLEGVITDYNPAAEHLFGYTAEEAIGRRAEDLVVPGHLLREEAEALVRIRQGRAVAPYCTVRARKDGGLVPVQVSASPIRAPDGTVSGVATVIRDITRQVESEERIRAANASLERQVAERTAALKAGSALQRAVLDHAGYAVIATDMQGTITLFNPAAERMLGYAADALVGRASPALFHDPVEVVQQARRLSLELGRTIEPGFEVFVARARLGQPNSDAWTYLTRAVSAYRCCSTSASCGRRTGRNSASSASPWTSASATGTRPRCGRPRPGPGATRSPPAACASPRNAPASTACRSGGSRSTSRASGRASPILTTCPRSSPTWSGPSRAAGATPRSSASPCGRAACAGSRRSAGRDGRRGRSRRVIGLTLDISARKEAEIALAEAKAVAEAARAEAERANRAKTDFLAAMSHEIRTPLNAVIGFTDLMLASGRLDPGNRRQAELVRSSGSALLTVVNDILDFSKVEAGAVALVERPFALPALVETCVLIVRGQADAKGLDLRLRMDPALPRWLLGDENRLRQVLFNLLNNAVKFTGAGSITLDIAPEVGIAGDERLHFRVIDTGIGIPQEKQSRLFQRFSQVDGSIQRDYGGTGLGLAICRHLVRLMGGEIGVSSVDGCGSTFWFTVRMPRASAPESVPAVASAPVARCAGRLLLVDDSPINRELARAVLEGAGHAVVAVADGQAAVEAVRAGGFDLVLMDVQMPGMDGMTATRLIRSLPGAAARLPVIAMTANVLPDQVAAFHEAGMDDHVGKPFDRDTLCGTIERWLPAGPAPAAAERDAAARSAVRRLLAPSRLREVLRHLVCELDVGFDGDPAVEEVRARLRHRAHALSSAAAMMGFCDLAAACRDLEALDEASSAADGLDGFLAVLARVRRLADRAARSAESMLQELERAPEACSVRTNSA